MIKTENHNGYIEITNDFFANLVGRAVTSCFGVAGMADANAVRTIKSILRQKRNKDDNDRGVSVHSEPDGLTIELHIAVTYGVNISEIVKSIRNKVRFTVEQATDFKVKKVNIYVDQMKA